MNNCENCANHNSKACWDCVTAYVNNERQDPSHWKPFPMTNADRIRAMSDEELARMLANEIPHGDCYGCELNCASFVGDKFMDSCEQAWYMWLKKIAED